MIYRELLSYIYSVLYANYLCSQWIRIETTNSIKFAHFSVLSPFQRFIPISAFYPHFSVLSPFQRFIPISAFYPYFSVLSSFQRFIPISVSVSAIPFQRFIPTPQSRLSGRTKVLIKWAENLFVSQLRGGGWAQKIYM